MAAGVAAALGSESHCKLCCRYGTKSSMTIDKIYRHARRVVIAVIGGTIILFGIILLVLPGPGLAVIISGMLILGTEFVWAKRKLNEIKHSGQKLGRHWTDWYRRWRHKGQPPAPHPQASTLDDPFKKNSPTTQGEHAKTPPPPPPQAPIQADSATSTPD